MKAILSLVIVLLSLSSISMAAQNRATQQLTQVKLVTSHGDIVLALYGQTPLHRNNFLSNVREGVYDSVLFHRVIDQFMIQSGDEATRPSVIRDSLTPQTQRPMVPAEFNKELFHKKGVLAAARNGNPERASSATQFYIVQGKVMNDSLLQRAETRINNWLAQYHVMHDPVNREKMKKLEQAMEKEDMQTYMELQKEFSELAKTYEGFEPYHIPQSHQDVYKSIGGTPHLDQNYTVFGEVVSGLEVVDAIAQVQTDDKDKPVEDVWIISAEILEDHSFDKEKDLLLAHFDCKTDVDDLHSAAALFTLMSHPDLRGVNHHAVAGAYGVQEGLYVHGETLFQLAYDSRWTDAHQNFEAAVQSVKQLCQETLMQGGDIWVAEAGQSDFTAALVKALLNENPELNSQEKIHVVQHSDWNEQVTAKEALSYVKQHTQYVKIPDGNGLDNGSPGFRDPDFDNWRSYLSATELIDVWTLATELSDKNNGQKGRYLNEAIESGGLDFSDLSETCWILGLNDLRDVEAFFKKYAR